MKSAAAIPGSGSESKPALSTRKRTRRSKHSKPEPVPLLPPENPIEVAPEGTIDDTVNQRRLREFYELQEEFYNLRDRYMAKLSQMQDLIIRGAAIQQGTYKVDYGVRLTRRPKYKQVVIDLKGEEFQKRVLENTPPHAHFRVRVQ